MPIPGGLGSGVIYPQGQLTANEYTMLATYMASYRYGLNNLSDWIFTTATNRTEKGVEVLGAYRGTTAQWDIYDWSCMPTAACDNGATAPSYVRTINWSALSGCYFTNMDDGGGHYKNFIRYRNLTSYSGGWNSNEVYLMNFCGGTWDLLYSHGYPGAQKNCSADNSCGWWGPIIETFSDLPSNLKEVSFYDSKLRIGSNLYSLTGSNTSWVPPSSWTVFHRTPNYTWGVGGTTQYP